VRLKFVPIGINAYLHGGTGVLILNNENVRIGTEIKINHLLSIGKTFFAK
jgi:hypothetical protein